MRVHELAKQLVKESKELIAWMNDNGYEGKTASSSVDDSAAAQIKAHFGEGGADKAAKEEPKAKQSVEALQSSDKKESLPKQAEKKQGAPAQTDKGAAEAPAKAKPAPKQGEAPRQGEAPKKKKSHIIIVSKNSC